MKQTKSLKGNAPKQTNCCLARVGLTRVGQQLRSQINHLSLILGPSQPQVEWKVQPVAPKGNRWPRSKRPLRALVNQRVKHPQIYLSFLSLKATIPCLARKNTINSTTEATSRDTWTDALLSKYQAILCQGRIKTKYVGFELNIT